MSGLRSVNLLSNEYNDDDDGGGGGGGWYSDNFVLLEEPGCYLRPGVY